jgi:hypothetical protein
MKRLRWIAIVSTTITALLLFVGANTGLALPPVAPNGVRPPCFPVFELPLTDYSFELPLWMWAVFPFVFVLSVLVAATSWVMVLFRWRALTRLAEKHRPEVNS